MDVTLPKTVSEVPAAIRQWGKLLGTSDDADMVAARVEMELGALTSEPPRPAFRYAYWIWKDPWMTISDDTYVADLIRLVGGENVYGKEAVRYPTTHPSEALAREAEVHIFPSEPFPFARGQARRARREAVREPHSEGFRGRRQLLLARGPHARRAQIGTEPNKTCLGD